MATTGMVKTNTEYESYFWVEWKQLGNQDIPNNRTQIEWSCGLYSDHRFYSNAVKMSGFTINGVLVYSGGIYSNFTAEGKQTITSGTMWITHAADGTKTFSISSFTGWLYSNHNYSSNGGSFSLTQIPRQATLTSAPDFTDLDNPTITYSNPAGNAVTSLRACISFTGAKDDIAYRDIPKTGSSYQFPLTDAERTLLRNRATAAPPSTQVIFYVTTTIGSNVFYSTEKKTFTVTENDATKPTVKMTVGLDNGSLSSAFDGLYIQGKSKVGVALSASGKYGADINSFSAVVDGKTYNLQRFTSDVIQTPGAVKVVGYAKDSRGFTGSAEQTINVIEYSKPLVVPLGSENAIQCYRSDENGNKTNNGVLLWIKAKMSWHNVNGKNACSLQVRSKKSTEEWNQNHEWEYLLDRGYTTSEFNALYDSGPEFALDTSYTVQIRAIDDVGEYDIKTFEIPTRDVALHLGKGGKNVAVGTYCDYSEEHTFYSEWKAIFDKDVVVGGDILIGENKTTLRDYILSVINGGG